MKIIKLPSEAQRLSSALRNTGKIIGFVPTMGFLHEGHLSLIKKTRAICDVLFVSIYVNPAQFGKGEDYEKYPRDINRDILLCRQNGVDYLFTPDNKSIYPEGFSTYVDAGSITEVLEGRFRPGHFRGVTTIVLKLFNIIQPHIAVFGQKDAQQAAVIRKMVRDLNVNTKILVHPTVREKDGLAMSSRNIYLNPRQRLDAGILYKALKYAENRISDKNFKKDLNYIKSRMEKLIKSKTTVSSIDYISFNNNNTLEEIKTLKNLSGVKILVSLAVRFGKVRLIDNIVVKR
jgi:pantoate--beta-alanine ligase